MIRLFLALCLLALADLAAAQVAVVRSGAHDGFDRLVLDMPARMEWHSEINDDGASVFFKTSRCASISMRPLLGLDERDCVRSMRRTSVDSSISILPVHAG